MQPDVNAPQNVNPEPQAAPQPAQPAPQQVTEPQPAPQIEVSQPPAQQPAPQPDAAQPAPQPPAQQPASLDYDKLPDAYLGTPPPPQKQVSLNEVQSEEDLVRFFDDFANRIKREATTEVFGSMRQLEKDKKTEESSWEKVFEKHPHAKNPTIRQTIHNLRLGAMVNGGDADLVKVADSFFENINGQYQQGYQAANQQTYVQRSQHLANNNVATPPTNVAKQTVYDQMNKGGVEGEEAAISHVQYLIDNNLI